MKLAAIALAALFAFASATAFASCGSQHVCADGYTWTKDGTCVPKTVSS